MPWKCRPHIDNDSPLLHFFLFSDVLLDLVPLLLHDLFYYMLDPTGRLEHRNMQAPGWTMYERMGKYRSVEFNGFDDGGVTGAACGFIATY